MSDLQNIITGCMVKDIKCQKLLYEKFYGYALRVAFRYIYRYDYAADVVNDSFVKLFRNMSSFVSYVEGDTEPRLMAWIKKIVINTAIDELRRNNPVQVIGGIGEHIWEVAGYNENADSLLLYKELISHLKSLPPSYSAVFNMHVIDGFSHKEIARQLNISVGTSKSNLSKAKCHLQKLINKEVA